MSALICSHCQTPISGKYMKDYWGNTYHSAHVGTTPQCRYCGRLVSERLTSGGKTYEDGRIICNICSKEAVNDEATALSLVLKVHDMLANMGITISPFKPKLFLIDRGRLKNLDPNTETQGFAKFSSTTKGSKITKMKMEIYILKGLPQSSFLLTAAHELMHIWFYSRGIFKGKPKIIEGSCNYAGYLIMEKSNLIDRSYRIKELFDSRNPIYGGGFRKIHRMVESKGIQGWLKTIQKG